MIVTIWRHGEAGEATSDRLRELTDRGEDDISFAAHRFREACQDRKLPAPNFILHSPWVRTVQTAGIISAVFSHAELSELEALRPGNDIDGIDSALAAPETGAADQGHILLVSHQPLVSYLLQHYLGEPDLVPALSQGALATLSLPTVGRGCGQLLFWSAPPEYEIGL